MEQIDNIFLNLENAVEMALPREDPERFLHGIYDNFWRKLKLNVGTSNGFERLSEYLFFRYLLRKLGKNLNITFEPGKVSKDTYGFFGENLLLTHDIKIARFVGLNMKPDFTVMVHQKGNYYVLAAFEMKNYITSPKKLKEDLEKLAAIGDIFPSAILIQVHFYPDNKPKPGLCERLCGFCKNEFPGRAFVVSPINFDCNIGLSQCIDKICESYSTWKPILKYLDNANDSE